MIRRKCVAWDLDDTVWEGICLEGEVRPRPEVRRVLAELDGRGIIHCVASRGDQATAQAALDRHGLDAWFVAKRINWEPKPANLRSLAEELGLGIDAFVFVDDDAFEREQVEWMLPSVRTVDARDAAALPSAPDLSVWRVTAESARRRTLYQEERSRREAAERFPTRRAFLDACQMRLTVRPMEDRDLPRVLELMSRTHQLNTTGRLFSGEDMAARHGSIAVASLRDRYGDYGTIGVAIASGEAPWTLAYLAISCRVMGRGVERALLATLLARIQERGDERAQALYKDTGANRPMRLLLQMSGFREEGTLEDGTSVLVVPASSFPRPPPWLEVSP